jgi:glucose-1-phosphate cytidylyltransferase
VFTLRADDPTISSFTEKPRGDGAWINGGFFVLEPGVLDYIGGDQEMWEQEPMRRLAGDGELKAFRHTGFWHAMDTLRDKQELQNLWDSGRAPWKIWGDGPGPASDVALRTHATP